jgi:hypothetical protein
LRKADAVFRNNVIPFLKDLGARAGVLTLTFRGNLTNKRVADRAFAKFAKHVLVPHFGPYVRVTEQQARGAWHYHLLVDCRADIRTGYDFDGHLIPGVGNQPNAVLKQLRHHVKEGVSRAGFGFMSKLEPVDLFRAQERYLAKKIGQRGPSGARRHHRLITYSPGFPRTWWHRFSALTEGGFRWRQYVALRAGELECEDLDGLKAVLGQRWAFLLRKELKKDRTAWDSLPGAPESYQGTAPP